MAPIEHCSSMPDMKKRKIEGAKPEETRLPVTVISGLAGSGKTAVIEKLVRGLVMAQNAPESPKEKKKIAVICNDAVEGHSESRLEHLVKEGFIDLHYIDSPLDECLPVGAEKIGFNFGCGNDCGDPDCGGCDEDLLELVMELAESNQYSRVIIEVAGQKEPMEVTSSFVCEIEDEGDLLEQLQQVTLLDSCITVIDAGKFLPILQSLATLGEKEHQTGEKKRDLTNLDLSDRTVCDLLMDQIEAATHLCLTDFSAENAVKKEVSLPEKDAKKEVSLPENLKDPAFFKAAIQKRLKSTGGQMSTLQGGRIELIQKLLQALNRTAVLTEVVKSDCEPLSLNLSLTLAQKIEYPESMATATSEGAGWRQELGGKRLPEANVEVVTSSSAKKSAKISSFAWAGARRPFHPQRIYDLLSGFGQTEFAAEVSAEELNSEKNSEKNSEVLQNSEVKEVETFLGVVRSKGQVWVANANGYAFDWASCGRQFSLEPGEAFLGAVPREKWNPAEQALFEEELRDTWDAVHGDRIQRLTFMGINLDQQRITTALDAALLTEAEMASYPAGWKAFPDPFFGGDAVSQFFEVDGEDSDEEAPDRDSAMSIMI